MSGQLRSHEGMTLATSLVAALVEDDKEVLAALLAPMRDEELRTLVIATAKLAATMLDAEAEETGGDLEAPAARTFRLFAQAVQELG